MHQADLLREWRSLLVPDEPCGSTKYNVSPQPNPREIVIRHRFKLRVAKRPPTSSLVPRRSGYSSAL